MYVHEKQFSVLSRQFSVRPVSQAASLPAQLRTENSFRPTTLLRSPSLQRTPAKAAAEISIQTTSVGHNGSAATCRAPIYKGRETQPLWPRTRTPEAVPPESPGHKSAHAIRQRTGAWPGKLR